MHFTFCRLLVVLLLAGVTFSGVTAQEATTKEAKEKMVENAEMLAKQKRQGAKEKQLKALPARVEPDQARWYAHYKKQPNILKPSDQLLNEDSEPGIKDGFVDLFNGKDLTGWTPKGGTCTFEVIDGNIVGTCLKGAKSTYLCTDKNDYQDFIFTCEMKWEVDGNSGVMFRSKIKPNKKAKEDTNVTKVVYGPQVEMEEFEKGRFWSGGVYGQSCGGYFYPLWLKEHVKTRTAMKKDSWNRLTISAKGDVVKTWVNGVPMAHWVDAKNEYPKGYFGLQIHSGKKGKILFRNLKVKEFKTMEVPAVENVE